MSQSSAILEGGLDEVRMTIDPDISAFCCASAPGCMVTLMSAHPPGFSSTLRTTSVFLQALAVLGCVKG
jgi:hypothetical protein